MIRMPLDAGPGYSSFQDVLGVKKMNQEHSGFQGEAQDGSS